MRKLCAVQHSWAHHPNGVNCHRHRVALVCPYVLPVLCILPLLPTRAGTCVQFCAGKECNLAMIFQCPLDIQAWNWGGQDTDGHFGLEVFWA